MNIQQARELAAKKLAGLASDEEIAELQAFRAGYPDKEALTEALLPVQELSDTPDEPLPPGVKQRVLSQILGASWQQVSPEMTPGTTPVIPIAVRTSAVWRRLFRAAVAAAVILVVGFFSYRSYTHHKQVSEPAWVSLSTPNGKQKSIVLKDGTHIQLNGGSTIRFPENFSVTTREVTLDGEAFFEVSRDSLRPFTVRSSTTATVVLGTSFSVRSYSSEPLAQIAVSTGKVRVEALDSAHGTVLLTPGRMASYSLQERTGLVEQAVRMETIGGWMGHVFYYDQARLSTILADLERSYDLHFVVKDPSLLNRKYTTTFKNIPVNAILKVLEQISPVTFRMKGKFIEVGKSPKSISHS